MSTIHRFIEAQQGQNSSASFEQAYNELKAGGKQSHWIWYVFPQLKQLGFSSTAQYFGIVDFNEACAYLQKRGAFSKLSQSHPISRATTKKQDSCFDPYEWRN
ncbi:DUF1810 family protein [Legionella cherrii]|uniref:Uncharacterized conserved protein n=1 Tax=Legionella cherrii TaxID=28084 RepID=A0ABY6T9D9_9GAMM|nr:DUF1810 family protein [Legionella cherrii]VEB39006.1 Uncharacterized conserved protein [Legionella cherrii]